MAIVNFTLSFSFTPAYEALLQCAYEIAEQEGEERALEWAQRVMSADIDLFCRTEVRRRPHLRLIQGGR